VTALVGCLGGGQLGRMLALAGAPLGVRLRFLDPSADACAGDVGELLVGAYDDPACLGRLADGVDAVTYEFENVPVAAARTVGAVPDPRALDLGQDRLVEKDGPLDENELAEGIVPFERELSIVAVRGRAGETAFYPVTENEHRGGILAVSRAPAPDARQREAEEIAARLLDELGYVGVLAVELFEAGGNLLANEFAPRVHNSGHWTIDGAETSQFENHLRAILGLPLGVTAAHGSSVMVNLVGKLPPLERLLSIPGAHVQLYGKEPRQGRKLGHVTLVGASDEAVAEAIALARVAWTV